MDISNFMEWFHDLILSGFSFCYDTLDSITFAGTTLLDFCLWVLVLSALIPLIFALGRASYIEYRIRSRAEARKKSRQKNKSLKDDNEG